MTKTLDIDKRIVNYAKKLSVVGLELKNNILSEEDFISFQYDTMYDD